MKVLFPFVLQLAAFLVVIGEILVPSFGILSITAVALIGYSWYYILTHVPDTWLFFLIGDMVLLPLSFKLGFYLLDKSSITLKTRLAAGSSLPAELNWVGKEGRTETLLKPVGKALIEGKLVEVTSAEGPLEPGIEIQVIDFRHNEIFVRPITTKPET